MEAIIYRSTGSWYVAKTPDGKIWQCRIAGRMKMDEEITSTNPVAVGDHVNLEIEDETQHTAIISEVKPRNNYMVRSSPHQNYRKHIIASNLDQAIVIATLREPRTSRGFIDRFLVTAEAYHVPAIILFNKKDVYREKEQQLFQSLKLIYGKLNYPLLLISAFDKEDLLQIGEILKDKTSLFAGHSGVGKSTLINALLPDLKLKIQAVSTWSGKGLHSTTFAEMHELPAGGRIIDTPGIREWGIIDMEKTELSHYFIEMRPFLTDCRFNNCLHVDEPGCAVKEAVTAGKINMGRYESYLAILFSLEIG